MTLKGSTSQACAACKYQRRRCTPECALAPHFRPEQTEVFKNAHKLFGVRNIKRILKQVDPAQTNAAMKTIIYQANMRERFPVYGCLGVIYQLNYDIRQAEEELHAVLSQLAVYKQQQPQEITLSPNDSPESQQQLQLGMGMVPSAANAALTLFQQADTFQDQFNPVARLPISTIHESYTGDGNGNGNGNVYGNGGNCYNNNNSTVYIDSKDNVNMHGNAFWVQQTYGSGNDDSNNNRALISFPLTIQEDAVHDYDEIQPFFDTIDDRQSFIDSKEAYDSSPESSLKDTTHSLEHVAENELKSAELQLGILSE